MTAATTPLKSGAPAAGPHEFRPRAATLTGAAGRTDTRLTELSLAIAIGCGIADVVLHDPLEGLSGRLGAMMALLLIVIVWFRRIASAFTLFLVAFSASFVTWEIMSADRLSIGSVPINITELALVVAIGAACFRALLRRGAPPAGPGASRTALVVAIAILLMLPAFVVGIIHNGIYIASRDLRTFLYIAAGVAIMRMRASSAAVCLLFINTMILGGAFGMVVATASRIRYLGRFDNVLDLRSVGSPTPMVDFTFAMATAFVICGESLFTRKWATWALFGLSVVASVFTLRVTAYGLLLIVPVACIMFAPISVRAKIRLVVSSFAAAAVAVAALLVSSAPAAQRMRAVVAQVLLDVANFNQSIHFESRLITWQGAFSALDGHWLAGVGLGTRIWIDTGLIDIGTIVAGEPTYSTYLIGAGLVGVAVLMWLQIRLPILAYRRMNATPVSYMKALRLGILVYGIATMVNCFFHNNFMTAQTAVTYGALMAIASGADLRERGRPRE